MAETKGMARRKLESAQPISITLPVRWEDRNGVQIALTVNEARDLFKSKYPLTNTELLMFLHQARSMRANPFRGDVYLIKYGQADPASIVTGYHFFVRTARQNPDYQGYEQFFTDKEGQRIPDGLETPENVIAAICDVYIKGYQKPVRFVARMKEFNTGKGSWKQQEWAPDRSVMMLGKCSIGNAHRLADPGALCGMYLEEEVAQPYVPPANEDVIEGEVVVVKVEEQEEEPKQPQATEPTEQIGSKENPDPIKPGTWKTIEDLQAKFDKLGEPRKLMPSNEEWQANHTEREAQQMIPDWADALNKLMDRTKKKK